jgi:hypothetical protein
MLNPEEQDIYDFIKKRENFVKYYEIEGYARARGIGSPFKVLQRLTDLNKIEIMPTRKGQMMYRAK